MAERLADALDAWADRDARGIVDLFGTDADRVDHDVDALAHAVAGIRHDHVASEART